MAEISPSELHELLRDTVGKATSGVFDLSDEQIEYNLFEEFDVGAQSFLHQDSLNRLRQAGWINDEAVSLGKEVRELWFFLMQHRWNTDEIKHNAEWRKLFELCDRLILKLSRPNALNESV